MTFGSRDARDSDNGGNQPWFIEIKHYNY